MLASGALPDPSYQGMPLLALFILLLPHCDPTHLPIMTQSFSPSPTRGVWLLVSMWGPGGPGSPGTPNHG